MVIVSRIKSYVRARGILDVSPCIDDKVIEMNYPVNLDHVTWLETDSFIIDPDNNRKPAITFHLVCTSAITWAGYETEKERDMALSQIKHRTVSSEINHL